MLSDEILHDFPIFYSEKNIKNGCKLIYLDNAATTQKPISVIEAESNFYKESNSNVHRGLYDLSERATKLYEEARANISFFINGGEGLVTFTSGATDSINNLAVMFQDLIRQDEYILTTELEHHSNLLPWQRISKKTGASLEYVMLDENNLITEEETAKVLEKIPRGKLKIFAVTHCSNVTGVVTPLEKIIPIVRIHSKDVLVVIDGAQSIGHIPVDLAKIDPDFFVFSGHKMYGPMGIGVLWMKKKTIDRLKGENPSLEPAKVGGGMISDVSLQGFTTNLGVEEWEAGTQNVCGAIGLSAAVDYIRNLSMQKIVTEENKLFEFLLEELATIGNLKMTIKNNLNLVIDRIGVVTLYFDKMHPHDISELLSEKNIAVRAGHHCALPFHKKNKLAATVRISLGVYNSKKDILDFLKALDEVLMFLN